MDVGFHITCEANGESAVTLHHPPRAVRKSESLFSTAENDAAGLSAVLMGTLHYRDDLRRALPPAARSQNADDAELALATFLHRGITGLKSLEGDFSLAILDHANRRVIAMRDGFGAWPLYWTFAGETLHVGTGLRRLRPLRRDADVDLDYVTQYLMCPFAFHEMKSRRTAFEGCHRVMPGEIVELQSGGRFRVLDQIDVAGESAESPSGEISTDEATRTIAELFEAAVRERCQRGVIAAHLSGGMDSSAVVCQARKLLANSGSEHPLHTLSLVFQTPSLKGEADYIQHVIDQGGPILPHFVDGDAEIDFDWFDEPISQHDEPVAGLARIASERSLTQQAAALGATHILTGAGPDDLFGSHRMYIADLLRRGRVLRAFREARRWGKANNMSLWPFLWEDGIQPNIPACLRDGLGTLLRGGRSRWPKVGMFSVPPWMRPEFAKQHDAWNHGLDFARSVFRYPFEETSKRVAFRNAGGNFTSWYFGAPQGMQVSHPFMDRRLVAYCLGLPRSIRAVPGSSKHLLREATRGLLPEPIRNRRIKAFFNDIMWRGLAEHLPQLEEMVRSSRISELGFLDADRLIEAVRQHAVGIGNLMVGGRIHSTMSLIHWFDRLQTPETTAVESETILRRSAKPAA